MRVTGGKDNEGFKEVLEDMHNLGMNCGNKISILAKAIHPDCIAIIPLYRSCIVLTQSEEEKDNGTCTVHAYGDPHWLGEDIDIETLKNDRFHFEFKIYGQRNCPGLVFKKDDKSVHMPISHGFDFIEMAEKYMSEMFKENTISDTHDNVTYDPYEN